MKNVITNSSDFLAVSTLVFVAALTYILVPKIINTLTSLG